MQFNTLEDLRNHCDTLGLPLEKMRFALGENKGKDPKWFFIYQDASEEWIVAKNKTDGTTVERYRGKDETKAVSIIAEKMEDECNQRGLTMRQRPVQATPPVRTVPVKSEPIAEPWTVPDQQEWYPESTPRRRRSEAYELASLKRIVGISIIAGVILLAVLAMVFWATGASNRGHGFGSSRPTYSEPEQAPVRDPADNAWFWAWFYGQQNKNHYGSGYEDGYQDGYYDGYDDTYDDWGYGYTWDDQDWGYPWDDDYDWSWDDGSDWDWDYGDSSWDSDWDSGWDWDSDSTDWDSDW